jgi:hypothetical protein
LKDYISNSNEIINTIIIDNLVAKIKIIDIDNDTYMGIFVKSEISSLKYASISSLFFQRLNIKVSHKTIKDFVIYITRYLENNCDRASASAPTFVLNKNYRLKIKNMNEDTNISTLEEYKILINF